MAFCDKSSWSKYIGIAMITTTGLYLISFVVVFQMLGYPSRTQDAWIGPTPRLESGALDIGKVNQWEEKDVPLAYSFYRPLCKTWLFANGLSDS